MTNWKSMFFRLVELARPEKTVNDEAEIIGWATHEDGQHYPIHAAQGGSGSSGGGKSSSQSSGGSGKMSSGGGEKVKHSEEVKRFAEKYRAEVTPDGEHVKLPNVTSSERAKVNEFMSKHKDEVLAYAKEEKQRKEQQAEVKSRYNEGINAIRSSQFAWEKYKDDTDNAIYSGRSIAPAKPKESLAEVRKKYPDAAAYMDVEKLERSSNPRKSEAGRNAMGRIMNGENPRKAYEAAEKEWKAAEKKETERLINQGV